MTSNIMSASSGGGGGMSNLASSLSSLAQNLGNSSGGSLASQFSSSDLGGLGGSGGLGRSLSALGGDSSLGGGLGGLGSLQGNNLSSLMGSGSMSSHGGMGGMGGGMSDDRDMGRMNYNRNTRMDVDSRDMSRDCRTVMVKNLPYTVTWQELKEKFQECGEVKFAEIKLEMGRSKGQGTVRFNTSEEAKRASERMNGARVGGRDLVVRLDN